MCFCQNDVNSRRGEPVWRYLADDCSERSCFSTASGQFGNGGCIVAGYCFAQGFSAWWAHGAHTSTNMARTRQVVSRARAACRTSKDALNSEILNLRRSGTWGRGLNEQARDVHQHPTTCLVPGSSIHGALRPHCNSPDSTLSLKILSVDGRIVWTCNV